MVESAQLAEVQAEAPAPFSVAVFAYNESELIGACLDSIRACDDGRGVEIHVLINGCTDNTAEVVAAYAAKHPEVRPVHLSIGDKANAWNSFVHTIADPSRPMHAFIDGDMTIKPGSLVAMERYLEQNQVANAVAALPESGRSQAAFRAKLVDNHELAGNFYVLRGETVAKFREKSVRLPIGQFGEDGLVAAIVRWDFDSQGQDRPELVGACEDAAFLYASLTPSRFDHWMLYHRRRMRYATRRFQQRMLYPVLRAQGLSAMPVHVNQLYLRNQDKLVLQWRGLDTIHDYLAVRRVRERLVGIGGRIGAAEAAESARAQGLSLK